MMMKRRVFLQLLTAPALAAAGIQFAPGIRPEDFTGLQITGGVDFAAGEASWTAFVMRRARLVDGLAFSYVGDGRSHRNIVIDKKGR